MIGLPVEARRANMPHADAWIWVEDGVFMRVACAGVGGGRTGGAHVKLLVGNDTIITDGPLDTSRSIGGTRARHATREALLDAYVAPLAVRGTEASFWESFGEYGALTLRAEAYMPHTASRPLPYLWVTQDDDDFGVGEWRWTYELPVGTVLRAQLLGRPEPTSRHIERIRAAVGTDDWEGVTAEVIQSTSHIVGEYALQQAVAQHEWREAQLIAGAIELITRRTDDAAESTLDFLNWP